MGIFSTAWNKPVEEVPEERKVWTCPSCSKECKDKKGFVEHLEESSDC